MHYKMLKINVSAIAARIQVNAHTALHTTLICDTLPIASSYSSCSMYCSNITLVNDANFNISDPMQSTVSARRQDTSRSYQGSLVAHHIINILKNTLLLTDENCHICCVSCLNCLFAECDDLGSKLPVRTV